MGFILGYEWGVYMAAARERRVFPQQWLGCNMLSGEVCCE